MIFKQKPFFTDQQQVRLLHLKYPVLKSEAKIILSTMKPSLIFLACILATFLVSR
ncbi:hypothetical protein RRG08_035686, partial [Elysia crispata]